MKKESYNEFDLKALTWDDNPLNVERAKSIAGYIRKLINITSEMNGFEFGCGTGLLSINLQPYFNKITLADNSDGMLQMLKQEILKQQINNMEVVKSDFINGEIPSGKYNIIYTAMTIHHIEDISALYVKFYGMLNNSGFLAIADLDKEDGSFHGDGFTGHKGFTRDEMKLYFTESGFKNVRSEICYNIVRKDETGLEITYPVFIMVGEK